MKYVHKKQAVKRIEPETITNRIKSYILRQIHLRAAKNPQQILTIMVAPSVEITPEDLPSHKVVQVEPERLKKMGGPCTVAISLIYDNGTPEPEVYTDHA